MVGECCHSTNSAPFADWPVGGWSLTCIARLGVVPASISRESCRGCHRRLALSVTSWTLLCLHFRQVHVRPHNELKVAGCRWLKPFHLRPPVAFAQCEVVECCFFCHCETTKCHASWQIRGVVARFVARDVEGPASTLSAVAFTAQRHEEECSKSATNRLSAKEFGPATSLERSGSEAAAGARGEKSRRRRCRVAGAYQEVEKAVGVLGADNPEAKGFVSVLKKARAQSQSHLAIGVRLDSCRVFVERAKKRLAGAEEAVTKAFCLKSTMEAELEQGLVILWFLREEVAVQLSKAIPDPPPGDEVSRLRARVAELESAQRAEVPTELPTNPVTAVRGGESIAGHSRRVAAGEDLVDVRSRSRDRCVER